MQVQAGPALLDGVSAHNRTVGSIKAEASQVKLRQAASRGAMGAFEAGGGAEVGLGDSCRGVCGGEVLPLGRCGTRGMVPQ